MVQETLLAAWQVKDSFAGKSSESTWLVAILKRKIIDHFRRNRRQIDFPDEMEIDDLVDDFVTNGERVARYGEGSNEAGYEIVSTPKALQAAANYDYNQAKNWQLRVDDHGSSPRGIIEDNRGAVCSNCYPHCVKCVSSAIDDTSKLHDRTGLQEYTRAGFL